MTGVDISWVNLTPGPPHRSADTDEALSTRGTNFSNPRKRPDYLRLSSGNNTLSWWSCVRVEGWAWLPRVCVPRTAASKAGTVLYDRIHYLTSSCVVCLCCVGIRPPRHVIGSRSVTWTLRPNSWLQVPDKPDQLCWPPGVGGSCWKWGWTKGKRCDIVILRTPCKDPHNGRVRKGSRESQWLSVTLKLIKGWIPGTPHQFVRLRKNISEKSKKNSGRLWLTSTEDKWVCLHFCVALICVSLRCRFDSSS